MVQPTLLTSLLANANNNFRSGLLVGISLSVVVGCSSSSAGKNTIVGIWKFDQALPQADSTAHFNADGTYSFSFVGDKTNDEMFGTYKVTGNHLEMKQTKAIRSGIESTQPNNWTGTITFRDNDHVGMIRDGDGASATYTRK